MTRVSYLETSAAAKVLVLEPESDALRSHLDRHVRSGGTVVSSFLLETEMRRMAVRLDLDQLLVSELLDRLELVEPDRSVFAEAGLLPGRHLRSLDALHIATAVRVNADDMLAYDARQAASARAVGLRVLTPA